MGTENAKACCAIGKTEAEGIFVQLISGIQLLLDIPRQDGFCPYPEVIRVVEGGLNVVAGLMLLGMMFLGACDVVGRYLFNSPITGAMEISSILMGGMVFLAWASSSRPTSHYG